MRWWRMAIVAMLVVLGAGIGPGRVRDVAAVGAWAEAANPPQPNRPSARGDLTPLPDARVLLTRYSERLGQQPPILTATLYDPAADRWTNTAPADPAAGFAAPVLLRDGRVLVSGGGDPYPSSERRFGTAGAQLYEPAADRWTPTGALAEPRVRHTATLLPDGTVLVTGGQVAGVAGPSRMLAGAERYDPQTGRWSAAGALAEPRANHAAVALRDGRVLVVGGQTNLDATTPPRDVLSAELFDPASGRWGRAAEPLRSHGGTPSATLLADGRVLVIGGAGAGAGGQFGGLAELYDPAANTWTLAAPLRTAGFAHTAARLPDDRVLVVSGDYPAAEVYDPASDRWAPEIKPPPGATDLLAPLHDGRILSVGYNAAALYTAAPGDRACFAETGKCIAGRFLEYWRANGGLARNGFPISDERIELLEDGRTRTVQYFERVRLEYHPENLPPYDVLLGQFGRRMLSAAYGDYVSYAGFLAATKPGAPLPGARFFPETGHNLGGDFLAYWEANGGLAQFGYPITDERWDTLPSAAGACCRTQYFERARFELHTDSTTGQPIVLLGQFGRRVQEDNAKLGNEFGSLYLANTEVRDRLGAPRGPEVTVPGALQPFENGLMIWRGDARRIFVLVGTELAGSLATTSSAPYHTDVTWPDTWVEGEDPGGGAAPVPGLYLPGRGFGKLWREAGLRNRLGYATTPGEFGFSLIVQEFAAGFLLSVEGPGGRATYAIYLQATGSHNAYRIGSYERVAAP